MAKVINFNQKKIEKGKGLSSELCHILEAALQTELCRLLSHRLRPEQGVEEDCFKKIILLLDQAQDFIEREVNKVYNEHDRESRKRERE